MLRKSPQSEGKEAMVSVLLGHGIGVVGMWRWCHQGVSSVGIISRMWCLCCRDVALVLSRRGVGVVGIVGMWRRCHWDTMSVSLRGSVGVSTVRRGTGVVGRR